MTGRAGGMRGPVHPVSVVRPEIAASWRRSTIAGLSRESDGRVSTTDVDGSSVLMAAATPVLGDLAEKLGDGPFCLILADRDCRIVYRSSGDHRLGAALEANGITVGSGLSEEVLGTNGLGTPLETGGPVEIHGPEHFLHAYRELSCYGHPVRHPLTGRVEGILDITTLGPTSHPLFRPLVSRAAQDIEERIVDAARVTDRRLFLTFEAATRKRSSAVAVLDDHTVLMSRTCADALGSAGTAILRTLLPDVHARGMVVRSLDLGSGRGVEVAATRVDGVPGAAIFRLAAEHRPHVDPALRAGAGLEAGSSMVVSGEPGTGRTSAVLRAAGVDPVVTLDAAAAVVGSERAWAARFAESAARDGVVLIEDAHLLSERLCAVVSRALSASGRARIALTTCPASELPDGAARLVARCGARAELDPLRERLHELPVLIAGLAAASRPGLRLTLTPRALGVLAGHAWPGNLVELDNLVRELVARPLTGPVDAQDLPERYRMAPRCAPLAGRDRAERIAIMNALRLSHGNKSRAAAHLGISRTTLYSRIRALGVPDGV